MGVSERIPWRTVEPQIMLAAMAPTAKKKYQLLTKIAEKNRCSVRTLEDRLLWIGYRHIEVEQGPAAIDEWERQMRGVAQMLYQRDRLHVAVVKRAMDLRHQLARRKFRSVSVRQAAGMLRVRPAWLESAIHDLELLSLDGNGRVPLQELRRFFFEHGWWLIRAQRFLDKTKGESIGSSSSGRAAEGRPADLDGLEE